MAILTEYPFWLIIFCILLGATFAIILYFKNKDIDFGKRTIKLLYVLRGFSITLIAFLILAPLTKMTQKITEKPILFFAVDNSESIISIPDSNYYKTTFLEQLKELQKSFGDKYEVIPYLIGDKKEKKDLDKIDFSDKSSNLSQIFDEINNLYSNRNVGALLLFTDGIYNQGANPFYKISHSKYPVYTIGMGDPSLKTDLYIADIVHNNQTFKGNRFPVEIKIAANKLKGESFNLSIFEGNNEITTQNFSITSNQSFETVKLFFEAKEKGLKKYRVVLTHLKGEITYKNNSSAFYIEVVDQREKIAIIYNSPHPDVAAIKSALELSDKYQLDIFSASEFKNSVNQYSLLILHQLPSITNSISNLINEIQNSKVSVLYILGTKSNYNTINTLNTGLTIVKNKELTNESLPVFNENFVSFAFSEDAKKMLLKLPPLTTAFGDYKMAVSSNQFLYQKISGVTTNYPLILFNDHLGAKTGVVTGTGIWQWRVYNYLYQQNHDVFNEIVNKIALYLSVKGDKSRFRIDAKNIYSENENIQFGAELYNDSYELQNDADVQFVITSENGNKYPYQFSKQDNSYFLNVGELPSGDYTWNANVNFGKTQYSKSGVFTVRETFVEVQNLIANHSLLQTISETSKGSFYVAKDFSKLKDDIKNNDNIKTIAVYQKKYSLLLNSVIYFSIIILLLTIEWFIRKWNGGY